MCANTAVAVPQMRQALHLSDLKPTSLEAHHKMLEQAGEYANQLRKLQKVLRTWEHYTTGAWAVMCILQERHCVHP